MTMASLDKSSCLIIIPAHNEASSVGEVIRSVKAYGFEHVVVIDDASQDHTIQKAQQAGAGVLPLAVQLGAWGATQAGLRYAAELGYQFVITIDADGQHEAEHLDALCAPILDGDADVVIGACIERASWLRKLAWVLLKRVSGLELEDITSGFRAYHARAVQILIGCEATLLDYQDIGVLVLLQVHGVKIHEVQVNMCKRRTGKSKIFGSWLAVGYYMFYSLILGFSKRKNL